MRLGLLARMDDRGIGHITWEVQRHLHPHRTLVVDVTGVGRHTYTQHRDRYPDVCGCAGPLTHSTEAIVRRWNGHHLAMDDDELRIWLAGLDVLYAVETFYDERLPKLAREVGCATVLHGMPEFVSEWTHQPDVWWWPTLWRLWAVPPGPVVPIPVPICRHPEPEPAYTGAGPLRLLHTAGVRALADRNGTHLVYAAARQLGPDTELTVTGQTGNLPDGRGFPLAVHRFPTGVDGYWNAYRGQHVLVLPRRFGGLCMPAIEAAAAGVALVMSDVSPNDQLPAWRVPAIEQGAVPTPCGDLPLWGTDVNKLAALLRMLAAQPDVVAAGQAEARAWAAAHSWAALAPVWWRHLSAAANGYPG